MAELSAIYDFTFLGGEYNEYVFLTDYEVEYVVRFKPSGYIFGENTLFANHTYEFAFQVSADSIAKIAPQDVKIPPTIASIFLHFFQVKETVVVYTCETSDRKFMARVRKFDAWFERFNQSVFIKIDRSLNDFELHQTYYNSLIIRQDNPFRHLIIEAFDKLISGFEDAK